MTCLGAGEEGQEGKAIGYEGPFISQQPWATQRKPSSRNKFQAFQYDHQQKIIEKALIWARPSINTQPLFSLQVESAGSDHLNYLKLFYYFFPPWFNNSFRKKWQGSLDQALIKRKIPFVIAGGPIHGRFQIFYCLIKVCLEEIGKIGLFSTILSSCLKQELSRSIQSLHYRYFLLPHPIQKLIRSPSMLNQQKAIQQPLLISTKYVATLPSTRHQETNCKGSQLLHPRSNIIYRLTIQFSNQIVSFTASCPSRGLIGLSGSEIN